MRASLLACLLCLPLLAGCLDQDEPPEALDAPEPEPAAASHAVVAHVDTGINPYHETFRDDSPRAWAHPSTYLPGYPEDAVAVPLTFDAEDYWSAVVADCESVWSTVEPGTLYWFPGTRIVGAIYLNGEPGADCQQEQPVVHGILDYGGHGTMVASRTASSEYGACPECLLVHVQGFSTASTAWAGQQATWIDAQSNSWGPFLPVPGPSEEAAPVVSNFVDSPEFAAAVEQAGQRHLSFWASGNGAGTRFGAVGHPTLLDPRMTPSIVMVGGHDSGYVNTWPDWPPHVVSDSCDAWGARIHTYNESADDVSGGTSGATPYAAGEAADLLLHARRMLGHEGTGVHDGVVARGDPGNLTTGPLADGELTLEEWKRLLFVSASPRPEAQREDGPPCSGTILYDPLPVLWRDVPDEYPEYLHIGYGATDDAAMERALAVLHGVADAPDRSETDAYFALDAEARQAFHDAYAT